VAITALKIGPNSGRFCGIRYQQSMGLPRICNDAEHTHAAESGTIAPRACGSSVCSPELRIVPGGRLLDIVAGFGFEVVANNSISHGNVAAPG